MSEPGRRNPWNMTREEEYRDMAKFMAETGRPDLALAALALAEQEAKIAPLKAFFGTCADE